MGNTQTKHALHKLKQPQSCIQWHCPSYVIFTQSWYFVLLHVCNEKSKFDMLCDHTSCLCGRFNKLCGQYNNPLNDIQAHHLVNELWPPLKPTHIPIFEYLNIHIHVFSIYITLWVPSNFFQNKNQITTLNMIFSVTNSNCLAQY